MAIFTVRYAHLQTIKVKVGQTLKAGDIIGTMGHTGYTEPKGVAGTHLHIDVVAGKRAAKWLLSDMGGNNPAPNHPQLVHFIYTKGAPAKDLLKDPKGKGWIGAKVTNGWLGYENHYAYDVIGAGYHHQPVQIYWNRSFTGTVITAKYSEHPKGYDPDGYGNFVHVVYDTGESTPQTTPTVPPKPPVSDGALPKQVVLKGVVFLYNGAGKRYLVPSTREKTCQVLGEKGTFYKVKSSAFDPDTVYVKKKDVQPVAVEENTAPPTYMVQRGDTLWDIARQFGTSYQALAKRNGITQPNRIHVGQTIYLAWE